MREGNSEQEDHQEEREKPKENWKEQVEEDRILLVEKHTLGIFKGCNTPEEIHHGMCEALRAIDEWTETIKEEYNTALV